ncbi:DUF771 domain-containing protein [Lacticaseibacillus jixiensis]|uniref:DUF771 domain-containing protein n=1 Tax=Lacticaseibacillus jixiensis TaxID=3231926 RepID=UPI0036F40449
MDTIEIQPKITIELPADKILVDRKEYDELKAQADMQGWWTLADVSERYKRRKSWFVDNILTKPTFEAQLRRKIVMYDGDGGRGYLFEPHSFSEWMQAHFKDIADEVGR